MAMDQQLLKGIVLSEVPMPLSSTTGVPLVGIPPDCDYADFTVDGGDLRISLDPLTPASGLASAPVGELRTDGSAFASGAQCRHPFTFAAHLVAATSQSLVGPHAFVLVHTGIDYRGYFPAGGFARLVVNDGTNNTVIYARVVRSEYDLVGRTTVFVDVDLSNYLVGGTWTLADPQYGREADLDTRPLRNITVAAVQGSAPTLHIIYQKRQVAI